MLIYLRNSSVRHTLGRMNKCTLKSHETAMNAANAGINGHAINHAPTGKICLKSCFEKLPAAMAFALIATLGFTGTAIAEELQIEQQAGVIDAPVAATAAMSVEQVKKLVAAEQSKLAKKDRKELEKLAKKGERLAQVALGADFATEAQLVLFAPKAANAAISDALAWYSLAAQRGYPGTRSLNNSGVKFHPVRAVRKR